eukprot:gene6582-7526_t
MYVEGVLAHGCVHYARHCLLLSPCCNRYYSCRRCHDEDEDENENSICEHQLERRAVKRLRWGNHVYDVANALETTFVQFAAFSMMIRQNSSITVMIVVFVALAVVITSDIVLVVVLAIPAKDSRITTALSMRQHLHSSTRKLFVPPCNHILHDDCYRLLLSTTVKCPLCSQSYFDISTKYHSLEKRIQNTPMPPQYINTFVHIRCRDCAQKSYTRFHSLGHKCQFCQSYNTAQLNQPFSGPPPALPENESNSIRSILYRDISNGSEDSTNMTRRSDMSITESDASRDAEQQELVEAARAQIRRLEFQQQHRNHYQ